jgi:hypothetical protein
MPRPPSIVPQREDRDIYLVLDDFGGRAGRAWRETDEEDTDRAAVLRDLLAGQYNSPVRIIAFNTAERWSRDVSADLADELVQRCADEGREIPASIETFVERHGKPRRNVQLPLPLPGASMRGARARKPAR